MLTDEHAIPAGLIRSLNDELVQVLDHMLAFGIVRTDIGWDVGENRVLPEVVLDNLWDVRVNDLIVCNARPRSVCKRDAAGPIDLHNARHAEHRVGAER